MGALLAAYDPDPDPNPNPNPNFNPDTLTLTLNLTLTLPLTLTRHHVGDGGLATRGWQADATHRR